MNNRTWPALRWLAVLLATLAASTMPGCGGGVGSGGTGSFASGPITGFGSIIVNEVRFDDGGATVEDGDGVRRGSSDLRLGMTVEVDSGPVSSSSGSATASASRIRYDSELLGPVASVDVAGSAFTVLGQRVAVDATTVFDPSLGGLSAALRGAVVEVYAVYDPAGARYRAKRVDPAASSAVPRVRGPVGQLDTTQRTLSIAGVTYSYGGASAVPGDLASGQFVRLQVAALPVAGRYTVQSFTAALSAVPDADGASLKGLISSYASSTSFSVSGRPVDASAASFPDGRAGLGLGVRVEVKGSVRSGTLRATEVKIRTDSQEDDSGFELHGAIESVNAAQKTLVLRGLTVSTARSDLRFENGTAANLVVGRRVEVEGRLSSDRLRIDATLIKFE